MKLKLKSSARIKRRYILSDSRDKEEIEKIILDYLGILGWAKASPIFLKNRDGGIIFAIDRKEVDNVRAAFEISNSKIKIIRVSGTLKGLEK